MLRRNWQLDIAAVLIAFTASASAQSSAYTVPAASVTADFSSYHQSLSNAADLALANSVKETEINRQIASISTTDMAQANAATLHRFAQQYWNGNDEAVRRAVLRVTQLKPVLAPLLQQEGIPYEIAALVIVESGGQPSALSPKGARGIWQFMPDTGRRFGLTINSITDDRLDILKSTHAAARYLRQMHTQFGDWSLALAAYNAGEIAVQNAVLKSGSKDFAVLSSQRLIPAETRAYVPAVMAAVRLLSGNSVFGSSMAQIPRSSTILYASSADGN